MKPLWSVLLASVALSACVVGPDYQTPAAPTVKNYDKETVQLEGIKLNSRQTIRHDWWQMYQSPALNALIAQGLKNSPTLAAASARLRSSEESLVGSKANAYFPAIDGKVNAGRQKISGAAFGNTNFGSIFTLYGASVNVTYDLNFFGKAQRFLEAQQAGIDYNAIQLRAARLTLVANIITTAVQEAGVRAQLAAQQEVIRAEQQALSISEERYVLGAIAKNELLLQRTAVAQLQTALPPLRKALAFSRHQLAVLVGVMPSEADLPTFTLAELHLPKDLPLSLPSTLAQQRPDIQGAEALLHQASAQVGVATANLYPQFSITSGMGTEGTRLIDILTTKPIWNLGANLLQPLFHAGELRAYKRAAEADFEQARAVYRNTLLQAFGNVADALQALQHDQHSYQLQQQAEALAKESHDLAVKQFAQGASTQLALLTAQSQWQQAHIAVVQARTTLLNDTTALLQALGGSPL